MIAPSQDENGKMQEAARVAAERARRSREDRELTIGTRLAQIGVLGWVIVAPILACGAIGRWLDSELKSGIFFTAPLIMIGAAVGMWAAWRWMHQQ